MEKSKNEKQPRVTRYLVSKFNKLSYEEKLDFMLDNFGGVSGVGNKRDEPLVLSVMPDLASKEQISMFNQWTIDKFFLWHGDDEAFTDCFYERLTARAEDTVRDIVKYNKQPDRLIREYLTNQLKVYKAKAKRADIQKQYEKYNGVWDLSLSIIDAIPFMKARAFYNYISYLENKLKNLKPVIKHVQRGIPENILAKVYKEFNGELWEDMSEKQFYYTFNPQNSTPVRLKGRRNNQVLIALLFKRICEKCDIPSAVYLRSRVGKTDAVNDFLKAGRVPRNQEMYERINKFNEKIQKPAKK